MSAGLSSTIKPPIHKCLSDEHIVGEWIDGKPVYERTIQVEIPTDVSYKELALMPASGVEVISARGVVGPYVNSKAYHQIPFVSGAEDVNYMNIVLTGGTTWVLSVQRSNTSLKGTAYITMRYYKT